MKSITSALLADLMHQKEEAQLDNRDVCSVTLSHDEDNKTVELEWFKRHNEEEVLNQVVHIDFPYVKVHFGNLLKRFDNLFGRRVRVTTSSLPPAPINELEHQWLEGKVMVGMHISKKNTVHVQMTLKYVSTLSLDQFLRTEITFENVASVFRTLYEEMKRHVDLLNRPQIKYQNSIEDVEKQDEELQDL